MNKRIESEIIRAKGVIVFDGNHPVVPPIARVTALVGFITGYVTLAEDEGGDQVEGFGDFRGGSATRRQLATALQSRLREIGRTARALPQDQFPGVGEQFRVGPSLRYQQIIDAGHGFLTAIGPVKAAFVERAYPADFDEQLADQIDAFDTATTQKLGGSHQRRMGTAGLILTMAKAKVAIDELDAILSVHYKATNPTLLAAWKQAVRVPRPAYNTGQSTAPLPPPPSGGGATLASTASSSADSQSIGGDSGAAETAELHSRLNGGIEGVPGTNGTAIA